MTHVRRYLFFDFGNTLVDSDAAAGAARRAVAVRAASGSGIEPTTNELYTRSEHAWVAAAQEIDRDYYASLGDGPIDSQLAAELVIAAYSRHLLAAFGSELTSSAVRTLSDAYLQELARSTALLPGVGEALAELSSAGFRMGIISDNMVEYVEPPLRHLGLADHFEPVIISGREGPGVIKPNPEIFRRALRAANCEASNAVMIGDNLECDIAGARTCGMRAIWFNRSADIQASDQDPYAIVDDLRKLPDLLI